MIKSKQEALAHMRDQISEDSKMSPLMFFLLAIVMAGTAIVGAAIGSLIWMAVALIASSVALTGGAVTALTKTYFKPMVEYWLAEEGDSIESKRAELQAELDALD